MAKLHPSVDEGWNSEGNIKQLLLDAGINCWAAELLIESYASEKREELPPPITFILRGIQVSLKVYRPGEEQQWLIWSNEHGGWWGPNEIGYVRLRSEAGRYSFERATQIVSGANIAIGDGKPPKEAMVREEKA